VKNRQWYLIESPQNGNEGASWWTGLWFSRNVNTAAMFPIKEHAEAALERIQAGEGIDKSRLIVTEHVWMDEGHTYCAYCGYEIHGDDGVGKVSEHIKTCEHHPMRKAEKLV
jgi:hypothetical protein